MFCRYWGGIDIFSGILHKSQAFNCNNKGQTFTGYAAATGKSSPMRSKQVARRGDWHHWCLIYNFSKTKKNSFQTSSLSTKWFYITLPSCHCYEDSAQTFPLLHVLCREVSSSMWWVLENYHLEHALLLLLCTGPLTGTWPTIKWWGFYPSPGLPFCLARLSLFVGRNNKQSSASE